MSELHPAITATLQTIFDPELSVNVWDLGLIYGVNIDEQNNVLIVMTFTTPLCPFGDMITQEIQEKLENLEGVNSVALDITFDPPWSQEMMSEEGKLESGLL
jgi:metal-sulfur cluster biosynthetic enzyme